MSQTSPMHAMLALNKHLLCLNLIKSSLSKRMYYTNRDKLWKSSSMRVISFQAIRRMLWVSFTMLGRREKRRKKRGGITVYRPRKPMYGRPSMVSVSIRPRHSKKVHDSRESILEQMKSIVIQRSSAKCFAQWGMPTSSCFPSTSDTLQPRSKSDCIRTNNAC